MAREFAEAFYKSRRWRECRKAYAASVGGLCERCLLSGVYKPGEIVHHKTHLNPETINDPDIALSWNNLELLCRQCHGEMHNGKRYKLDENGRVIFPG